MRVILAGQKSFGLAVHEELVKSGHEIVAVWSPGAPTDKKPDRLTALAYRLGRWVPPALRTAGGVAELDADLFVCAHSHDFIGKESRAATKLGGIGYHPSLLPRHRGRDAIRWTVRMGDPTAGGSVYWLTDNVDGGPIAARDWCFVPQIHRIGGMAGGRGVWDEEGLVKFLWQHELFPMGVRLIAKVLADLDRGVLVEVPQDERYATWEPSWDRPPLHRPELPQIGSGVNGFEHRVTPDALH